MCCIAVTAKFPPVSTEKGSLSNLIIMPNVKISKLRGGWFSLPPTRNDSFKVLLSLLCNFLLSWFLWWNMPLCQANFDHKDSIIQHEQKKWLPWCLDLPLVFGDGQCHFRLRCETSLYWKKYFGCSYNWEKRGFIQWGWNWCTNTDYCHCCDLLKWF